MILTPFLIFKFLFISSSFKKATVSFKKSQYFLNKSQLGAITPCEETLSWLSLQSTQDLVMDYTEETTSGAPYGLHTDLVIGFFCDCI